MLFALIRLLPVLIELGLLIYALIDCIQTPAEVQRHLPKPVWLLVILLVPILGSIGWLALGRPERTTGAVPWPSTGTAGYPEYERPAHRRPPAPDDDPQFLAGLAGLAEANRDDERRLAAWEENLRRREQQLEKDPPPDGETAAGGP